MTEHSRDAYRGWIGGEWKASVSGEWFEDVNPADTSDVLGRFPNFTADEAAEAVEAAAAAFPAWAEATWTARAGVLSRAAGLLDARRDAYAVELTREEGKPLSAARSEVQRAAATLRFYAEHGISFGGETIPSDDRDSFVFTWREPLGVVSVITPWNFPISIPARKIAPALVAGNAVVFKPASDTPLIALRLVECLVEAGLPPGVLNFVTGSARRVGPALVTHPAVRAVTFTGSTASGEAIHRQAAMTTRLQMELGGKNPLVVLADADLDTAVELAVRGGYELTGQACTGTSRVLVEQRVYPGFLDRLVDAAKRLRIGNGLTPGVEVGPLANARQLETVQSYVAIGQAEGARLVYGGEVWQEGSCGRGYFMRPAVFADVTSEMRIAKEEIFGPVLAVEPVPDLDAAIASANAVAYGLSAAVVTRDIRRAHQFVRRIQAGTVKVNRTTTGNLIQAPFGGLKQSSTATFRESGRLALEFFTQTKTVYYGS
ncbi:MAG: aldehyde dehydrogenase family protein [Alicyclobacillus sp.]|nr:aldehyde dehydrogenase family protein [Alicyclobacillus sp.]